MIKITAKNISEAWRETIHALVIKGTRSKEEEYEIDNVVVIKCTNENERTEDPLFPMKKEILSEYNTYILNGGETNNVLHEHALYHKRIFHYPTNNDQVKFVVNLLEKNPSSKRAILSLWDPEIDQNEEKVPCIQYMWFRVENEKLVMHVHMRANDAFKKLLMNLNICFTVQKHIAKELGKPCGAYYHIVDSMHIHKKDSELVKKIHEKIKNDKAV